MQQISLAPNLCNMNLWLLPKFKHRKWVRLNQRHQVESAVEVTTEGQAEYPTPPGSQASRIIAKFGGVRDLMRALEAVGRPRNAASIYKWTYPYPRGTGGLIPLAAWSDIITAARHEGILLGPEDTHVFADPMVPDAFKAPDALSALGKRMRKRNSQTPPPMAEQQKKAKEEKRRRDKVNWERYRKSAKGKKALKASAVKRQARIVAHRLAMKAVKP